MELVNDLVIVRIILKTPAGIDITGDAEAIQFPEEAAGRVDLIFPR
jgi:hypothetical protein